MPTAGARSIRMMHIVGGHRRLALALHVRRLTRFLAFLVSDLRRMFRILLFPEPGLLRRESRFERDFLAHGLSESRTPR